MTPTHAGETAHRNPSPVGTGPPPSAPHDRQTFYAQTPQKHASWWDWFTSYDTATTLLYDGQDHAHAASSPYVPPAKPLVCIETNPGPQSRSKSKKSKKTQHKHTQPQRPKVEKPRQQPRYDAPSKAMAGAKLGSQIGGFLGPIGSVVGGSLGGLAGHLFGFGDYRVKSNSLMGGKIVGDARRANVFRRSTYITDVFSSTGFATTVIPIQPGLLTLDPWLAPIARNYDEYEIKGMIFEWRSTCGSAFASNNNAMGTLIMATQYDPYDPVFTSKLSMDNYEFATAVKPFDSALHAVECARASTVQNKLYIRTGSNQGDLRWTDFGNFTIATTGMQTSGVNLGELWVSYEIELSKPNFSNSYPIGEDHHVFSSFSSANVFSSSLGSTISGANSVGYVINFPFLSAGTIIVVSDYTNGTVVAQAAPSALVNIAAANVFGNHSSAVVGATNAAATLSHYSYTFTVTTSGVSSAFFPSSGTTLGNRDTMVVAYRSAPAALF